MYYCNDCNGAFNEKAKRSDYDEPGTTYLQQSYGEEYVCPLCGGQNTEWADNFCSKCGDYKPDDQLHNVLDTDIYLCDECVRIMEQENADREEIPNA